MRHKLPKIMIIVFYYENRNYKVFVFQTDSEQC